MHISFNTLCLVLSIARSAENFLKMDAGMTEYYHDSKKYQN